MLKFDSSWTRRSHGWPGRWSRPASMLSRIVGPYVRSWMRRKRARISDAPRVSAQIPVICIGNLVVGGSGKSPLVQSICHYLQAEGWRPGIVSRGYGGRVKDLPVIVTDDVQPTDVGDEPVMLWQQTGAPVVVCRDRARAVERLCSNHSIDVVLADDGLQNTRLWRDLSVCVFNKDQGIGNGLELPFGPLREPIETVDRMDAVVIRGTVYPKEILQNMGIETATPVFGSTSEMAWVYRSDQPEVRRPLSELATRGPLHAVAGIAAPERFFEGLRQAGLTIIERAFPDHYEYRSDIFDRETAVITTEKDAVKLVHYLKSPFWVVALKSEQPEFEAWLMARLNQWSRV